MRDRVRRPKRVEESDGKVDEDGLGEERRSIRSFSSMLFALHKPVQETFNSAVSTWLINDTAEFGK